MLLLLQRAKYLECELSAYYFYLSKSERGHVSWETAKHLFHFFGFGKECRKWSTVWRRQIKQQSDARNKPNKNDKYLSGKKKHSCIWHSAAYRCIMHHYLQARNGEHIVSPTTYTKCPNCIQNPISGKVAALKWNGWCAYSKDRWWIMKY